MKYLLYIILGTLLFASAAYGASVLQPYQGGTGVSSFTASQLIYGNGTNALSSVATGTITGGDGLTVSATAYSVLADIDIDCDTASATAFGCLSATNWLSFNGKFGTSTTLTAGHLAYITGTGIPPTLSSIATTTLTGTSKQVSISNSPVVIGSSGAVISLPAHIETTSALFTSASTTNATTSSLYIGSHREYDYDEYVVAYASSTQGVGTTTTYAARVIKQAGTFVDGTCHANKHMNVRLEDETGNIMAYIMASSTEGVFTFSANNTFTANEVLKATFGTTTASLGAVNASCTLRYRNN